MASEAMAFDVGDYVVYPKHGVGRVIELQNEESPECSSNFMCFGSRRNA